MPGVAGRSSQRRTADPDHGVDPRIVSALDASGQRLTRHKAAVLQALKAGGGPVTADEVAAVSAAPTSTTYRILAELCDTSVAERVAGADRIDRFELAERFTEHHHHHLVCTECGSVADFAPGAAVERALSAELAAIGRRYGFSANRHVFDIHGTCAACAAP